MAIKLTERVIERLNCPEGKRDSLTFDTEQRGLAVRVMATGTKSYLAQFVVTGRKRRVPLGSVDAISLAAARDAARALLGKVAQGGDPAKERKEATQAAKTEAARERMTLTVLVDDWTRLHLVTQRPSYQAEAPRAIKKAFELWLPRAAERIKRSDVIAVLDKLSPSMRRAVLNYGSACFAWGVSQGKVHANPFVGIKVTPVASRERVLSDEETGKVWTAALATAAPYGPIVTLLLLTGQRRDEVGGMEWQELTADLSVWTIPAERAKNGVPNVVPLPPVARRLLGTPPKKRHGLVFPGRGGKPFGGWSKAKIDLDKAAAVSDWRLHDLRRTMATGLQRMGVRLEVTEANLNDVAGSARRGVVGVYQRHHWGPEKKAALEGWAAHLLALADEAEAPEKVVQLASKRQTA